MVVVVVAIFVEDAVACIVSVHTFVYVRISVVHLVIVDVTSVLLCSYVASRCLAMFCCRSGVLLSLICVCQ
jgi:hypothetical protein